MFNEKPCEDYIANQWECADIFAPSEKKPPMLNTKNVASGKTTYKPLLTLTDFCPTSKKKKKKKNFVLLLTRGHQSLKVVFS